MKIRLIRRYELTNAADGWPRKVSRLDREQNGAMVVRTWFLEDGRQLVPSADGHLLFLPGTNTVFVLPDDEE